MAGHDPGDSASIRRPVDDYVGALGGNVRGLRVGVPRNYFFDEVDTEVVCAFEETLAVLRKLGVEVLDLKIPSFDLARAFLVILFTEAFAYHEQDLRRHPELYGEVLRERILAGALFTGAEYLQAQRIRFEICAQVAEVMRTIDILAVPTTPKPAPSFQVAYDPEVGFPRNNTLPFNLTGQPSLALPCGFSSNGLPLSLQFSGRPFDEVTVLRLGHAYQRETEWHSRRPKIST
jgi:aspartyl-tRNA(Asn)/glutamyl-tRNA(Gln) amidotransferase subunit A